MKVNKDGTYEVEGSDMFELETIEKKRLDVIEKIILREVTMEKPRKKFCQRHSLNDNDFTNSESSCVECWLNREFNIYHDAMSAWIEGQMPTVEDIKKIIYDKAENYIEDDSGCDELRNEQAKDIHSLITRKLKGDG